eukprot:TRINITY_DN4656_c6_g1_i1.p1 TRINITY_DN4656_c6_g1~~TRINITY_DN4656_c6_g1_i1.p1  ORF type:complete len:1112 (+),score=299.44 TRINITY_DN4656_c6_g1_i1:225-3338(+)
MQTAAGRSLAHHALHSAPALVRALLRHVFDVRTRATARRLAAALLRLEPDQLGRALAALTEAAGEGGEQGYAACLVIRDLCGTALQPPATARPTDSVEAEAAMLLAAGDGAGAPPPAAEPAELGMGAALGLLRPLLAAARKGSRKLPCGAERPTRFGAAAADAALTAAAAASERCTAGGEDADTLWAEISACEEVLALISRWYDGLRERPCVAACAEQLRLRLQDISAARQRSDFADQQRRRIGAPLEAAASRAPSDGALRGTLRGPMLCLAAPPPDAPPGRALLAGALREAERAEGRSDLFGLAVAVCCAAAPELAALCGEAGDAALVRRLCAWLCSRAMVARPEDDAVPGDSSRTRAVAISAIRAVVTESADGAEALPEGAAAVISWLADPRSGRGDEELAACVAQRHPKTLLPELLRAARDGGSQQARRALSALRLALQGGASLQAEAARQLVAAVVACGLKDSGGADPDVAPLRHAAAGVLAELPPPAVLPALLRAACVDAGPDRARAAASAAVREVLCAPQNLRAPDALREMVECCIAHKRSIGAAFRESTAPAQDPTPSPLAAASAPLTPGDVGPALLNDAGGAAQQARRLSDLCVSATKHWAARVAPADWPQIVPALWALVLERPSEELCTGVAAAAAPRAAAHCAPAALFGPLLGPLRAAAKAARDPEKVFEALAPLLCMKGLPFESFAGGGDVALPSSADSDSEDDEGVGGDGAAVLAALRRRLWRVALAALAADTGMPGGHQQALAQVRSLAAQLTARCNPCGAAVTAAGERLRALLRAGPTALQEARLYLVYLCGVCAACLGGPAGAAGGPEGAAAAPAAVLPVVAASMGAEPADELLLRGATDAAALCLAACARRGLPAAPLDAVVLGGLDGPRRGFCLDVIAAAIAYLRKSGGVPAPFAALTLPRTAELAEGGCAQSADCCFNLAFAMSAADLRAHIVPLSRLALALLRQRAGALRGAGAKLLGALLAKADDFAALVGPDYLSGTAAALREVASAPAANDGEGRNTAALAGQLLQVLEGAVLGA